LLRVWDSPRRLNCSRASTEGKSTRGLEPRTLHDTYATAEENVREGLDEFGVEVCPVPERQSEMTEGPSVADAYTEKCCVRPG
jgi:hypothetical protein